MRGAWPSADAVLLGQLLFDGFLEELWLSKVMA